MPSRKFVWDPGHWRLRAEETRTVADQMTHEAARTIMRRIANDYDRLALHHTHPDGFGLVKSSLIPPPNGARRATPYETIRHQPLSRSRPSRPRTAPVRRACRITHHSPRDKSEPGPEGRTPEAGGRSLVARMKQQWASFSGLLKDMAGGARPPFLVGGEKPLVWGGVYFKPPTSSFLSFGACLGWSFFCVA